MLRKRIVTLLTINDGVLFRTKKFIPDYRYTMNFLDTWSVDEIVVIDVSNPINNNKSLFFKALEKISSNCFVPIAAGGGIQNLSDVKDYMNAGAEKVIVNSAAYKNPNLIYEIASAYGSQCVVVSLDTKINIKMESNYEIFINSGTYSTNEDAVEWAKKVEKIGAGEIMISSIDKDGSLQGYDIVLSNKIASSVKVPIILSSGAGTWKHFEDGFTKGNADAVCTSNIYHFTETSIQSAKRYLNKKNILIRK